MHRVEFHQQGMLFGIPHRIVQQHDLARSTRIDQVAQNKLSDPAKAVEGNAGHGGQSLSAECASVPMASTCVCSAIRLRLSNGSAAKAMIRRRNAP